MSSKGSVLVAMSGGVDSSVAAYLLLEQGFEVVGSHMQLVHLEGVEHGCCGPAARADAAEVASIAGFPFEICDLTLDFDEHVIDDFVTEHEAGRTPNPCARCNGEIKFGAFLRRADELGIDRVATGHYVRSERAPDGSWRLLRGFDRSKDQSYMLHMLGQRELSRAIFAVGGLAKTETRALAERFGLPVASKPDSQELCFAPSGDAGRFLGQIAPHLMREGEVVDMDGRVLAHHGGAAAGCRSIGERSRGRAYRHRPRLPRSGPASGPAERPLLCANRRERRSLDADHAACGAGLHAVPPFSSPPDQGGDSHLVTVLRL